MRVVCFAVHSADQPSAAYVAFTSAIVIQTITVSSETTTPTLLNHIVNMACVAVYVFAVVVLSAFPLLQSISVAHGILPALFSNADALLSVILSVTVACVPWLLRRYWVALRRGQCGSTSVSSTSRARLDSGRGAETPVATEAHHDEGEVTGLLHRQPASLQRA